MADDRPTFGSLFAGIGGFDLGLERAGWRCAWQVEIDPYCRRVLAKHWPAVQRFVDVHFVGRDQLEPVDLLCGGFPCQDLSPAGRKAGLEKGARSGLWREFRRIIGEVDPRFVVIENTHHRWRSWVPSVRRDLRSLRYASLPLRLRACDFGALHARARCFVVADRDRAALRLESWRGAWAGGPGAAWARDDGAQGAASDASREPEREPTTQEDAFSGGWNTRALVGGGGESATSDPPSGGRAQPGREFDARRLAMPDGRGWWPTEPDVARVVHGLPGRVERIRGLGNAVCPPIAEWIGRTLMETRR